MDVSKAAQHKLHLAVAERVPFVCQICDRRFATEYQMEGHTCQVPSSGDTTAENIATETTTLFVSPITVPVSPNPAGSQQRWLLMGHGLAQFRFVMVLDDVVKEILEEQFKKGVEKSSNRKGVLEMVEECGKIVPELMAPSVHDVNSWLSSRLAREKKDQNSSTSPTRKKKRNKTQREKRLEEAAVIKVAQRPQIGDSTKQHLFLAKYLDILLIGDSTKQHLFLAKYLDILLIKDNVTRIVTYVNFTVNRACWTLTAATALQDKDDGRISLAAPDKLDTITIDVSSKRTGPSTYIKEFIGRKFHGGPSMLNTADYLLRWCTLSRYGRLSTALQSTCRDDSQPSAALYRVCSNYIDRYPMSFGRNRCVELVITDNN
jgi:hypothetical protein